MVIRSKEIKEKINKVITENKKSFIYLLIIYIIALIPLMRANFNYGDDLLRNVHGYRGWQNHSRYLTNFLSIIMHPGKFVSDISPLTLILSIISLVISSIILIKIISDDKKITFLKLVAVIPLGLSPYFLQCLSYKYDSVYMSISILVCLIPFLFYKKKWYIYSITTIICMLGMCLTYQASSGIYPMIVVMLSLKMWNNKKNMKEILKFLIVSIMSYIIALAIFKFFIMAPVNPYYVSSTMIPLNNFIPGIIKNLIQYLTKIEETLHEQWLIIIFVIGICFIITSCIKSKQKLYLSIPVSIITLFLMLILSYGMYMVLEEPFFSLRALYGFGVFISIMACYAIDLEKSHIAKIACILLAWLFVNFSLTYGNALAEQKRYLDFRVQLLVSDMNELEVFNNAEKKDIYFTGNKWCFSPAIKNSVSEYEILKILINEGTWFSDYTLNYFDIKNINKYVKLDRNNMTLTKETMYHSIYTKNNDILIVLK